MLSGGEILTLRTMGFILQYCPVNPANARTRSRGAQLPRLEERLIRYRSLWPD